MKWPTKTTLIRGQYVSSELPTMFCPIQNRELCKYCWDGDHTKCSKMPLCDCLHKTAKRRARIKPDPDLTEDIAKVYGEIEIK